MSIICDPMISKIILYIDRNIILNIKTIFVITSDIFLEYAINVLRSYEQCKLTKKNIVIMGNEFMLDKIINISLLNCFIVNEPYKKILFELIDMTKPNYSIICLYSDAEDYDYLDELCDSIPTYNNLIMNNSMSYHIKN